MFSSNLFKFIQSLFLFQFAHIHTLILIQLMFHIVFLNTGHNHPGSIHTMNPVNYSLQQLYLESRIIC